MRVPSSYGTLGEFSIALGQGRGRTGIALSRSLGMLPTEIAPAGFRVRLGVGIAARVPAPTGSRAAFGRLRYFLRRNRPTLDLHRHLPQDSRRDFAKPAPVLDPATRRPTVETWRCRKIPMRDFRISYERSNHFTLQVAGNCCRLALRVRHVLGSLPTKVALAPIALDSRPAPTG